MSVTLSFLARVSGRKLFTEMGKESGSGREAETYLEFYLDMLSLRFFVDFQIRISKAVG